MLFTTQVHNLGYSERVSNGTTYRNISTCSAYDGDNSTFIFNITDDVIFEGVKTPADIPKFSKLELVCDYLTTRKGNFFILRKATLLK